MKRTSFAKWPCSIARTVDLVGDWWTPLVLREAFYGVTRFEEMQRSLGIGRNVLTERLQRLVQEGVLERRKYQDRPARFEYRLCEKGRDLFPVLAAMIRWGDDWLDRGLGAPVTLRHTKCRRTTRAEVVCAECGQPLEPEDVRAELGPGFPSKLASHPRVQSRFGAPAPAGRDGGGKRGSSRTPRENLRA
jgi:DNA-binding HxlR family transcriptional regulator